MLGKILGRVIGLKCLSSGYECGLLTRNAISAARLYETGWKCSSLTCYSTAPARPKPHLPSQQPDVDGITNDTVSKIEKQLADGEEGRLFAVVHLCGKQFKVTSEDIIIIEGYWPPQPSQQIILEKVLLVGGADWTLVGRPVLPRHLVTVSATVIEKDLSHTKPLFYKRRRKQYMRLNFYRSQQTMLRINDIRVAPDINPDDNTV